MGKQISVLTAIILSGFLGIALPGCSEDRNKSGDGSKSTGDAKGSTSSPGSGSGSSGTGGSTSGSGTSGSGGSGSGGSGS